MSTIHREVAMNQSTILLISALGALSLCGCSSSNPMANEAPNPIVGTWAYHPPNRSPSAWITLRPDGTFSGMAEGTYSVGPSTVTLAWTSRNFITGVNPFARPQPPDTYHGLRLQIEDEGGEMVLRETRRRKGTQSCPVRPGVWKK